MTTNLKVLMSAVAGAAMAVALFVSVPATSDLRDPANARFAQGSELTETRMYQRDPSEGSVGPGRRTRPPHDPLRARQSGYS